jgi:hypothetical protein
MTTTTNTTAQKKNVPDYELFRVEEKPADRAKAAAQGKTLAENAMERVWHKAGVGFTTKSGNAITVLVGERGDPKQKKYLLSWNSFLDDQSENARIPVASLFQMLEGQPIDFTKKDGVAFLNRDESLNLILGERGDPEQLRFTLRKTTQSGPRKSARPASYAPAAATAAPSATPAQKPAAQERKTVIRRQQPQPAA